MKVFFNHITKCGGTSIEKMIRQHSSFKYFRVKQRTNLDELSQIIEYMNTDKDVFIQGHIFDPLIDSKTRLSFWKTVYNLSDIRFTIVRHPLERALSYARFSGTDKNASNGYSIQYLYRFPLFNEELWSLLNRWHFNRTQFNINYFKCIMPDSFIANYPDNLNILEGINGFPNALRLGIAENQASCPATLRIESKEVITSRIIEAGRSGDKLFKDLNIPKYKVFALEQFSCFINWLIQKGIVDNTVSSLHLNQTENLEHNLVVNDESSDFASKIMSEYPESLLIWKMAAMHML